MTLIIVMNDKTILISGFTKHLSAKAVKQLTECNPDIVRVEWSE